MTITKGPRQLPLRVVVYGPEGVGKSTFGASAPSPLFIAAEDGCSELDVARVDGITSLESLAKALTAIPDEYRTVVVDSATWLESIIHREVARSSKADSVEAIPYGAGYKLAVERWRRVLFALDQVRAQGRHVVLTAHGIVRPWRDPDGGTWDRWSLSLHQLAADLVRQWCDVLLFANWEQASTTGRDGRTYGVATGRRLAFTERTASYDAKSRIPLKPQIELDWKGLNRP